MGYACVSADRLFVRGIADSGISKSFCIAVAVSVISRSFSSAANAILPGINRSFVGVTIRDFFGVPSKIMLLSQSDQS